MNIAQAKQVPIVELLAAKGFHPHHRKGADVWYKSPFRDEKTPSFKVNIHKNVWFDFGMGEGGDTLNLIQVLYNEPDTGRSLALLENFSSLAVVPHISIPANTQKINQTIIHSVQEIEHFVLKKFLQERGISLHRAKQYLSEIHYQRGDNSFFALAHSNEAGGFEVKNAIFSGSVNKKAITCIAGEQQKDTIAIFEGMFDFLALLELHNVNIPPHDVIVLNSLSLLQRAIKRIQENSYRHASLYLDNDKAGREASSHFKEYFRDSELSVSDHANSYSAYKDINDLLIAKQQKQITLDITVSQQDPLQPGKDLTLSPEFYEK